MPRVTPDERIPLEDQIRECYGRAAYTHKTHEKAADILEKRRDCYKVVIIILTGLSSAGVLAVLFGDEWYWELIAALLTFASFYTSTYLKDMNPDGLAVLHRQAAVRVWGVRESYLSILSDFADSSIEEVRKRRDELQVEYQTILNNAPSTNSEAYRQASGALQNNEELFFDEGELDMLLPQALRRRQE